MHIMENEKNIELIDQIFQMNKPKGVDTLELRVKPSSGRFEYVITPQYVIDKNDDFDLMKIIWKNNRMDYETKGDRVFKRFENDVVEFIKRYLGIDVIVSGRGVTEKEYWLSQKKSNRFPEF